MDGFLKGLADLSPVIGTVLGGPVGGAIGGGIKAIAGMITGEDDPEEVLRSLAADPEKLMELENEAKKLELEELRIHAADRDSARGLTARLAEAGSRAAWSASLISLVVTVGFFLMLYAVLVVEIPEASKDPALLLLGALGAGFTQVLNFWLGSSKGSSDKAKTIEQMMRRS